MKLELLHARVRFRDRAVTDVLDLALRFVVVHGRLYAKVALPTLLPAILATTLLHGEVGPFVWLAVVPLAILVELPFTILASRLVFEDHVRARDVLRAALSDAPRVFFARLLAVLLTLAGVGLALLPGLVLATVTFFVPEVMVLERGRVVARAQRLTTTATSEVVLGAILLALIAAASVLVTDYAGRSSLAEVLQFRAPPAIWTTGASVLGIGGLFLHLPFRATARFFLYLNVRTRAEGWDIQIRFAGISAEREA